MSDLISREELTKKLEYLCDCLCDYSKKQREVMCDSCKLGAVIYAVEEMLSVELERKTEDNIRRADVLELAKRGVLVGNNNYKSVCNAIEALPTADGTDQTAEWARCDDFGVWTHNYKCTHCGKTITCAESDRPNFCGNCGRRMRRKA